MLAIIYFSLTITYHGAGREKYLQKQNLNENLENLHLAPTQFYFIKSSDVC